MLFYISNPQLRPLSIFLVIFFIIWKRIVQKYYITKTVYPSHYIIFYKKFIRKSLQIVWLICFALLPLDLVLINERPNIDIILDNSLSMRSEDNQPTRLDIAKQFINELNTNSIVFDKCYILQKEFIDNCKDTIILPSSWSSVTDALLLSLQKSGMKLVFSDGGLNQWIKLDQIINNSNNSKIYRIDFYPSTWNIIISWQIIANQQTLEKIDWLENHYLIRDKSEEWIAFLAIKNAAISQHSYIHINMILVLLLLILWVFFSFQYMKQIGSDK